MPEHTTVDNIRKRVELARTHDGHEVTIVLPGEHVSLTTGEAEALCELADAARDARNEVRALEEWSRSHGYQHDAAMQREVVDAIDAALARLDGEDTG